jgi:hypothetical protein
MADKFAMTSCLYSNKTVNCERREAIRGGFDGEQDAGGDRPGIGDGQQGEEVLAISLELQPAPICHAHEDSAPPENKALFADLDRSANVKWPKRIAKSFSKKSRFIGGSPSCARGRTGSKHAR